MSSDTELRRGIMHYEVLTAPLDDDEGADRQFSKPK